MAGRPEFLSVLRRVGFSLSNGNVPSLNFKPLRSKVFWIYPERPGCYRSLTNWIWQVDVRATIKNNQGYPTRECMFPNTPEVSQIIVAHSGFLNAQLEACLANLKLVSLKTIYLFGCLRGSLVVKKVLGGFFVSSESVSYPYRSGRKFEDMKQPCFH